jgi:hypothetical protein
MKRRAPAVLLALLGLALAGCASNGGMHTATRARSVEPRQPPTQRHARPPRLVAIGRTALAGVNLRNGASLLSPARLAIVTAGSSSCPAVPDRLVVQNPDTVRIHLTRGTYRSVGNSHRLRLVHASRHTICTDDFTTTPMVIAIDPKQINVHHRLTVYLYYYKSKKPIVRYAPPL